MEENKSTYKYQRSMISKRIIKHPISGYNHDSESDGYMSCELDSSATGGESDGDMVGDKVTGLPESDMGVDVISRPSVSRVVSSSLECLALVLSGKIDLESSVSMTGGYCVTSSVCDPSEGAVTSAEEYACDVVGMASLLIKFSFARKLTMSSHLSLEETHTPQEELEYIVVYL